jgi:hypothetical protein
LVACAAVSLLACGSGSPDPGCTDFNCPNGNPNSNACKKDSDCGDGICGADGICRDRYNPGPQSSACASISCAAGFFCSNGACLPATAQCKAPDPACIFIPHGAFEPPVHQWWWPWQTPAGPDDTTGHAALRTDLDFPGFVQVMSTPVVIRLHATDAAPAVVFSAFDNARTDVFIESRGVLRAISGLDGSPLWTAPKDFADPAALDGVNGNSNVVAGDCLGTGEVCFVVGGWNPNDVPSDRTQAHRHGGLVAFGSDGRTLWTSPGFQVGWGGAAIARLLGPTGPAQIVVGNGVLDGATGKVLCPQTITGNEGDQIGGNGDGPLNLVADIALDGTPEIVSGNEAYRLLPSGASPTGYVCKAAFSKPVQLASATATCPGGAGNVCGAGFPAVASFAGYGALMGLNPADPHPQIVVVSRGYLRIHDWTGGMVLNPIALPPDPTCIDTNGQPVTNEGGAPVIADFDGDGLPEIGIAGQAGYVVWKPGKGFLWSSKTFDCSSNTGSSVFDFEGKGQANVVYGDQCYTRIYDGRSGATLMAEKNASCTAYEMPVVADIDGTGRARIVVPANNICDYVCDWGVQSKSQIFGLKALRSPSDKWVNTRSVWNEHTYHVTNVNIDGTLPYPEKNSWAPGQSNSYRQNVQGQGVFSAPDLVACEVKVDMTTCQAGLAAVKVTVYNGGALVVRSGVPVAVYADGVSGTYLIGKAATTKQLQPGDSEQLTVRWANPPQQQSVTVRAVVDEQQTIGDCHPENNTIQTSTPVRCTPLG